MDGSTSFIIPSDFTIQGDSKLYVNKTTSLTSPLSLSSPNKEVTITIPSGYSITVISGKNSTVTIPNVAIDDLLFQFPSNRVFTNSGGKYIYNTSYEDYIYTFSDGLQVGDKFKTHVVPITIDPMYPVRSTKPNIETISPQIGQKNHVKDDSVFSKSFSSMTKLTFLFLTDIVTVIIFWFLILGLSEWASVKSELAYPTKLDKFPYVLNTGDPNLSEFHPEDKSKDFCKKISEVGSISKVEGEEKEILSRMNPTMTKETKTDNDMFPFAKSLGSSCQINTNQSDFFQIINFWFYYLLFRQFFYQNNVLNKLHSGLSWMKDRVDSLEDVNMKNALFAFVLLLAGSMIHFSTPYIESMFKIKPDHHYSFSGIMAMCGVKLLSVIMTFIYPLFMILLVSGLLTQLWSLFDIGMNSKSNQCALMSFVTLFVTFGSVVGLIVTSVLLSTSPNSQDLLKGQISSAAIGSFFALFSIGIPLLAALYNSFGIIGKLVYSSLKMLTKSEMVTDYIAAFVVVSLIFLCIDVQETSGNYVMLITIMLILFFAAIRYGLIS